MSYGNNVGEAQRAMMDNTDIEELTMEELILQNAESVKQVLWAGAVGHGSEDTPLAAIWSIPFIRFTSILVNLDGAMHDGRVEPLSCRGMLTLRRPRGSLSILRSHS